MPVAVVVSVPVGERVDVWVPVPVAVLVDVLVCSHVSVEE